MKSEKATAGIRLSTVVLYLTVGNNADLLSGLLVDVNVTSDLPTVWNSKSL